MIVALAIPRAAWTAAFALFANILRRLTSITPAPANPIPANANPSASQPHLSHMSHPSHSPAPADPSTPEHFEIKNFSIQNSQFPDSPFLHDPHATPEQALREADALWQTLQHALQLHIQRNLSTPSTPDTNAGPGPDSGLPLRPPAPDAGIYLYIHSPRHLNILTLVLKRIQNSRIRIHQALADDAPAAPHNSPADFKLLQYLQQTITKSRAVTRQHTEPSAASSPGNANLQIGTSVKSNPTPATAQDDEFPALDPAFDVATDATFDPALDDDPELYPDETTDPRSQKAMLDFLLNNIAIIAHFTPDPNATLTQALRQCDALWQCLQTAIAPLAPIALTPHDLNNLTTAHWRITTARLEALSLLT